MTDEQLQAMIDEFDLDEDGESLFSLFNSFSFLSFFLF